MEVEPNALKPFEVTRDEAKTWLNSQFGQVLEEAKGKLTNYLSKLGKSSPESEPESEQKKTAGDETTSSEPAYPGLSLLSALTGEPVETLRTEPDAIARGIRQILSDLNAIFENATAPDAEKLQTARTQIQNLRSTLKAHGISVSEKLEKIPDRLREFYFSSAQTQNLQENAATLEKLAAQVEQTAAVAGKYLRTMAQKLREQKNIPMSEPNKEHCS